MSYPEPVRIAIAHLRAHHTRPIYAAAVLRVAYPNGMPEDIAAVHLACVKATKSWAGIDKALRALDGKVAA